MRVLAVHKHEHEKRKCNWDSFVDPFSPVLNLHHALSSCTMHTILHIILHTLAAAHFALEQHRRASTMEV